MSYVWERLSSKYPDGVTGGSVTSGLLYKLVYRFASDFFHNERRRNHQRNQEAVPLDSVPDPRTRMRASDVLATTDLVAHVLMAIPPEDRDLLKMRHGIGQDESTTTDLAASCGVTVQAVRKRLTRAHNRARREVMHESR